ncbi:MAG: hypothetical protein O2923_03890 [Verrucomicrobia bacterium]|nr:hypothetical protein [Verrucomicrobiota bacterium]
MTLATRAWRVLAPVSLILAQGALAQDPQLHIHGETPLPERLAVWADEAIRPLQLDALDQGAIPIGISLDTPSYVTLVVETEQGVRVRNLVSERLFQAGEHVIGWDGLDEAGIPAITQGGYDLYPNLVSPGKYRVRGLVRGAINLRYELSVHTAGNPPWRKPDGTGGWLADHSPPSGVVFLPGDKPRMLIGSFVAEAGDGLVWTDLAGQKLAGVRSSGMGGGWCGAYLMAKDHAPGAPEAYLTAAKDSVELWSVNPRRNLLGAQRVDGKSVQGIAARNGLVLLSLDDQDKLLLVDAAAGRFLAQPALKRPRGLAFDEAGRLLAVSGDRLLRLVLPTPGAEMKLPEAEVVIAEGLNDASQLAVAADGRIYISFHGNLHQVKVYSPDGTFLHNIGEPGGARLGPYDPRRMDKPTGLAIAPDGHLWVAENSHRPKRVSIWTLDGTLVKWLVGPPQYGGGGSLSADRKRFYYGGQGNFGLEFAVDWAAGTSQLSNLYYLPGGPGDIAVHPGGGAWQNVPQNPIAVDGREYLVNAWNSHPTRGVRALTIWQMRNGIALPVAAVGPPSQLAILQQEEFQARRRPEGNDLFVWSDHNDDGKIQPEEVTFTPPFDNQGPVGLFSIGPDLTVINANGLAFRPRGFTPAGAPLYDASQAELLVEGLMSDVGAAGGAQAVLAKDGHLVVTGGPMRGFRNGELVWTYPSRWPSLDAAHWGNRRVIASIPAPAPGLMVGTTHLIGPSVTPPAGEAGELWAINGNVGQIFLMTTDGLFVASLFQDMRVPGARERVPDHERGVSLNRVSVGVEEFWPSINQTEDGNVYVMAQVGAGGKLTHSNVIHVDGLHTVRRLPPTPLTVTSEQLAACRQRLIARSAPWLADADAKDRATMDGKVMVFTHDALRAAKVDSIRITLPGTGRTLNLSEVEIHADGKNIVGQAKLSQSSMYSRDFLVDRLVDGNTTNFAHTAEREDHPWFRFDFPAPVSVDEVRIWNRAGYEERFQGGIVSFHAGATAVASVRFDGPRPARRTYRVALTKNAHVADGDLKEWPTAWGEKGRPLTDPGAPGGWVQLGELPFHHKWWPLLGAVRVSEGKLHLAFMVYHHCLALDGLQATAADPAHLMTEESVVEVALATAMTADEERMEPRAGDLRVLISVFNGKPLAMLYRAVDPQAKAPLAFASGWGTTQIGSATDISGDVQVGQTQTSYEVSIPLRVLGIEPKPGTTLRADFGIVQRPYRVLDAGGCKLRVAMGTTNVAGHEDRVQQPFYWHNKATTMDAGPAGNAAFLPQLWGNWRFE